jgi:tetratricopeptide (TPR) repeat protein/transcriptional regulator with XRE-family HTH domain
MSMQHVRAHRRRLGLSQEELAARAGLSVRSIQALEAGRVRAPRTSTVRLLADAFELRAAEREAFVRAMLAEPAPEHGGGEPKPEPARVPALLPLDLRAFAGRARDLARLDAILAEAIDHPTATVVVAIAGMAGVGKTTLAVHWAHRVRDRFPDGQLYVNMRGFGPDESVMAPAEGVRRFLDALGVAAQRIPADPDAQADLYRSQLAERRVLIVIDNVRDADQVRPLLPGAPGCMVVVTSRRRLTGLVVAEAAQLIALDLLDQSDTVELLRRRIGAERIAAEPGAVDEISVRCGSLPLALAVVAARVATTPDSSLTTLAAGLGDLTAFATGDAVADVRAVFSWSYQALSPAAQRVFRLLAVHPGPDLGEAAIASLAGREPDEVQPLIHELLDANLLSEQRKERYSLHDLVRAYAAELSDGDGDAVKRMYDHYLHTAYAGAVLLYPNRDLITIDGPTPGVTTVHLEDAPTATEWFTAEHAALLALLRSAGRAFDKHVWQLAWSMTTYLFYQGHWHDQLAVQRLALDAAERLGDVAGQARAHGGMATAHSRFANIEAAESHLRQAIERYRQLGEPVGEARSVLQISTLLERQEKIAESVPLINEALAIFERIGHKVGIADCLTVLAWAHVRVGNYAESLAVAEPAVPLHRDHGNRAGEFAVLDTIGVAYHHLGDDQRAIAYYEEALEIVRDLGYRHAEADLLEHLGEALLGVDDAMAAREIWRTSLSIMEDLGEPSAAPLRERLERL